jgi:hypothetical protein
MKSRCAAASIAAVLCADASGALLYGQEARAQSQSADRPRAVAPKETTPAARARSGVAAPQGFSVILVLGDLQGTTTSDDVPAAARKALADMRDFLPFKSYRLLDAAWVMCCGSGARSGQAVSRGRTTSQMLRGPDDQEYELKLATSRVESGRVFVDFSLRAVADLSGLATTQLTRQVASLTDRRAVLEAVLQDARKRVELGTLPTIEVTKHEVELRSLQRQIDDLNERLGKSEPRAARSTFAHSSTQALIDTTFTMDVGETVVVGTSRQKGGTKALIALLTAVPPRAGGRD